MDSAGLRRRSGAETRSSASPTDVAHGGSTYNGCHIPEYIIDQSLPPVQRYQHVAADFRAQAAALPALFDEIILGMKPNATVDRFRRLARLLLRRVYYKEENEELRGISQILGIEMWLLVAFNVLLDLFMGCTSGAARVRDEKGGIKMLHFRTLDWGMDPLRKVVVHLHFIEKQDGDIIASTITYLGYVGVVTGVRQGLSMSLNFRPNHDRSGRLANFRFYFHHLLVLLGLRPSISSLLRQQLLPAHNAFPHHKTTRPTLQSIERTLPAKTTTAAYLIFSDGDRTVTMEKDHHTALVRSSSAFIVATNHDEAEEKSPELRTPREQALSQALQATGMQDLVDESIERKNVSLQFWKDSSRGARQNGPEGYVAPTTRNTIVQWINAYPITNEETHYATVMDAKVGKVIWAERHLEPLE